MLTAARAMQARGHRVTLAVQPDSELARRGRELMAGSVGGAASGGAAPGTGLRVRTVRLGGWLDPRSLLGLARILADARAEVVCANLDKEIRQARLAALLAGRPIRLVARRGSPVPIKDTWHYRLVYRHGVDRLICNARALVEPVCGQAPWFPRDRVRVIPNGVDLDDLAAHTAADAVAAVRRELGLGPAVGPGPVAGPGPAVGPGPVAGSEVAAEPAMAAGAVVTCVGEVGWRKGQEHVLTAAADLGKEFPGTIWLIVGEGDGRAELEERARAMGLRRPGAAAGAGAPADAGTRHGGVQFLGFRHDAAAIMAASDIIVLPSRSEGFPNTLVEGMALGRPVAASLTDGIPELIRHGESGLLHTVDDVQTFTDHLRRLLTDPDLRSDLGSAARARVEERFTERAIMDRIEAALALW